MFYQLIHPASGDYFQMEWGTNFNFPHHMHQCFEFIISLEGKMTVFVGTTKYEISKGEGVLIFPNQMHSLASSENKHMLCIFSPKLVAAYYSRYAKSLPLSNKFCPPQSLIDTFLTLNENTSFLQKKGVLYLLCDAFDSHAKYIDGNQENKDLLQKILEFIEANYKEDCSLEDLSNSLGYSYVYLSRYFKKMVGMSFNSYVNIYRLNYACYLLNNSNENILNIAIECGYKSIRSFNRNFKNHFGISPNEFIRGDYAISRELNDSEI